MLRRKARKMMSDNGHSPEAPAAPKPQQMRLPKPGERPPSRFAPGVPDMTIEKFDAYAKRAHGVNTSYNKRR